MIFFSRIDNKHKSVEPVTFVNSTHPHKQLLSPFFFLSWDKTGSFNFLLLYISSQKSLFCAIFKNLVSIFHFVFQYIFNQVGCSCVHFLVAVPFFFQCPFRFSFILKIKCFYDKIKRQNRFTDCVEQIHNQIPIEGDTTLDWIPLKGTQLSIVWYVRSII